MPDRVMQPIWDSVKKADGEIDFPLSGHRAAYNKDYDDYNDIYLQRWRKEDAGWQVCCTSGNGIVETP
jgi:hypothetical protein